MIKVVVLGPKLEKKLAILRLKYQYTDMSRTFIEEIHQYRNTDALFAGFLAISWLVVAWYPDPMDI